MSAMVCSLRVIRKSKASFAEKDLLVHTWDSIPFAQNAEIA
jgi:hypothetical protein